MATSPSSPKGGGQQGDGLDGLISPMLASSEPPTTAVQESKKPTTKKENFEWQKVLGYGSYSRVVLAVHKKTQKRFAVKVVSKIQVVNEKALLNCVKNERDILKQCNHPNIIKLIETFQSPVELYYVMEYAGGGELLQYIRNVGRFDVTILRMVAAELINGLEYLHNKGIVHRDLKPENLLLDSKNHIKLVDFGTAFMQTDNNPKPPVQQPQRESASAKGSISLASESEIRGQTFCGTFQYISPELLDQGVTTMASDLWAFGCILYQMASGRRPFDDGSVMQIFEKIRSPEKTLTYTPDFPIDVKDLIKGLLVLDPQQRLGTTSMGGYQGLKNHVLFQGIDFVALPTQELSYQWKHSAPPWVSDKKVANCGNCQATFTFTNRRHHCRKCGYIFCNSCSSKQSAIPGLYEGVKVCFFFAGF